MITNRSAADSGKTITILAAAFFFLICTWASYARWSNFEYRTFDLAFYVQGLWQFIHGRFDVSLLNVPLLGNHVEPIVFLFAPLFALIRHPMLFVVVQNAAVAAMAPVAYDFAGRLGLDRKQSVLLAIALLLAPATGFIALHEFHPETLSATLLLLMVRARLTNQLGRHWLWFGLVLACKESMALLLIAYCAVQLLAERKRGWAELRAWYFCPLIAAAAWFVLCTQFITPALNAGNVDYLALYDRLGKSTGDIFLNAVTHPLAIAQALGHALAQGNLVWGLLLPFLCLPLLKPRWLLIATPIFLQHLLSWRSSEWNIYFHYAAPLLPLCWIALVEAVVMFRHWNSIQRLLPVMILVACAVAQLLLGPAPAIATTTADWFSPQSDRSRKRAFLAKIPPNASVVAPIPYLSHLAMREKLYSLHHVIKGLKTLSRESYEPPPPTDFVFIDYLDTATFDPAAGYYHPAMKTIEGRIVPSSDRLLHEFLRRASWSVDSSDELTLFQRDGQKDPGQTALAKIVFAIGAHTELLDIAKTGDVVSDRTPMEMRLTWRFQGERDVFPWMFLRFSSRATDAARSVVTKGLCAPEIANATHQEIWHFTSAHLSPGKYLVEAVFVDNSKRAWSEATGRPAAESPLLSDPISLGDITVQH